MHQTTLFTALTRPQMFAGVTFTFFIINAVLMVELFLLFKSWWILPIGLIVHAMGVVLHRSEPRIVDLWLTRVRHCSRVKNHRLWRCNSYRP